MSRRSGMRHGDHPRRSRACRAARQRQRSNRTFRSGSSRGSVQKREIVVCSTVRVVLSTRPSAFDSLKSAVYAGLVDCVRTARAGSSTDRRTSDGLTCLTHVDGGAPDAGSGSKTPTPVGRARRGHLGVVAVVRVRARDTRRRRRRPRRCPPSSRHRPGSRRGIVAYAPSTVPACAGTRATSTSTGRRRDGRVDRGVLGGVDRDGERLVARP